MTALAAKHDATDCKQGDKIDRLDQEMARLNKAVFLGNGQPSIMAQLAVMRQSITAAAWIAGVTCAAVIGQIVLKVLR
jgi:hypothetical protein